MISIYKPYLPQSVLKYAQDALDSSWISSQGKYIQIAQERLQELLNIKYALLLNNGTSACHLVAKSVNKKGIYKVIVPNNVYIAAINVFLFDCNTELIAIDCDIDTWNYDLNKLDTAIKIHPDAAVLVVHNMGNIINVPELKIKYPNTIFVEDNCEGLFGKYNNIQSGTASYVSAISFYGNKTLTSGEGGCFITNDEYAYLYAKCIHGQGQSDKKFIHNELGYNYRMTNIQAAILVGQLEVSSQIIDMKQSVFDKYRDAVKDREDVFMQTNAENTQNANWMFGIRIPGSKYEDAEKYFNDNNIEIRPMFFPINVHKHIKQNQNIYTQDCKNAELLNKECIILPSYPELNNDEQGYIIDKLNEYVKGMK